LFSQAIVKRDVDVSMAKDLFIFLLEVSKYHKRIK